MPDEKPKLAYTQTQLTLPLLSAIDHAGGKLSTSDAYEAVAAALDIDTTTRTATIPGTNKNAFERSVRWARQQATFKGLMHTPKRGTWEITSSGKSSLRMAKPGIIVTLYCAEDGTALWADCKDAFAHVESDSVQCVVTSPPYALATPKQYGNLPEGAYLDWLTDLATDWKRILTPNGSLVLNLGDCWQKGSPTMSLYAERLLLRLVDECGFSLCQRFEWFNPSKMPAPAEYVNIRRIRVKPSLERIYWLGKSPDPYADNRQVLIPYSNSMQNLIAAGGQDAANRPSGHIMREGAFAANNGGAIPPNLIIAANTSSNSTYQQTVKSLGLPIHPARFPSAIPELAIRLLTKQGDVVADPFGGSLKTAAVAQKLGRRFVTAEKCLDYALGGLTRIGGDIPAELLGTT